MAGAIPRLVVGGASSGAGKTTVTAALVRALRARGLTVQPFKCGPDYLDPGYLARAAGRPCHNLDGWMMGREACLATFARAARDAHVAVIEGVMGLYDGATPTGDEGSTAEVAKWLDAPVLAVIDASGMARTVAAVARGLGVFDPALRLDGIVCNRIGGRGHLALLEAAQPAPRVVGGLPARADLAAPERHLGLRTADEATLPEAQLDAWGRAAEEWLDLDAILGIARSAPALPSPASAASLTRPPRAASPARCRIGVAHDAAFHFYYEDNLARLEALGAELVRFSPIADAALPDVHGLYLGGGYPELHAAALAANGAMRAALAAFAGGGGPIYAECGGLMALCRAIRTADGVEHAMAGVLPGVAVMGERLAALGYQEVETRRETILGPAGLRLRGHEYRWSSLAGVPDGLERAYALRPRWGGAESMEGYTRGNVLASYVHAHWASCPAAAAGLVDACAARAR